MHKPEVCIADSCTVVHFGVFQPFVTMYSFVEVPFSS